LDTARTGPTLQQITVVPPSVLFFENPMFERLDGRQSQVLAPTPQGKEPIPALSKRPPARVASEPAIRRSQSRGTKRLRATGQSDRTAEPGADASEQRHNLRAKASASHAPENADGKDDGRTKRATAHGDAKMKALPVRGAEGGQ
jgi:hypothetical protein